MKHLLPLRGCEIAPPLGACARGLRPPPPLLEGRLDVHGVSRRPTANSRMLRFESACILCGCDKRDITRTTDGTAGEKTQDSLSSKIVFNP